MSPLIFECPRTRRAIDAGVRMDKNTLAATGSAIFKLYCPDCCGSHELLIKCGRLAETAAPEVNGHQPPKAPTLAIAINALRISWLKRGLPDCKV
jgi:hypothetical protein